MILVTVELVPGGFDPLKRKLAQIEIGNISDLADLSDYLITGFEGANPLVGTQFRRFECRVARHDRRQSVWKLVERAACEASKATPAGCETAT